MARTKQTAAMSAGSRARRQQRLFGNGAVLEVQVDDSEIEIDDETKARHKEIEEGEMRAELKFLDKKHTDKGQSYYADTIDEDVPEQ
ncbi:hypothetical protein LTR33_003729, partial [Friedmanniomyces endolithicus]